MLESVISKVQLCWIDILHLKRLRTGLSYGLILRCKK